MTNFTMNADTENALTVAIASTLGEYRLSNYKRAQFTVKLVEMLAEAATLNELSHIAAAMRVRAGIQKQEYVHDLLMELADNINTQEQVAYASVMREEINWS